METVSNIAASASKMIWGEQQQKPTTQGNETAGQEPISGQQGKGTADEPFDKGNSDLTDKAATSSHLPTTELPDRTATSTSTSSNLPGSTVIPSSLSSDKPDSSFSNTPKSTSNDPPISGANPTMSSNPINAAQGGEIRPEHETDKTGVVGGMSNPSKGTDVNPSSSQSNPGVAPHSGAAPTHKQQGADRPTEAPASSTEEKKDDAEDFLRTKSPDDHSGEPMKMHGAPAAEKTKTRESWEERRQSKAGVEGGQEHGKEPKGTGEEWVKTSGLAAEGGDFDATKPGAGREADRLMEEKGIKKSAPGKVPDPNEPHSTGSGAAAHGEKEKVPLGQKLKDKLHIGHKDKS